MILVIKYLGGQFALSATTPQSAAPLRSAASLWGNRYYRGRRFVIKIKTRTMNLENINDHLEAYKNHDQIIDAAEFIISTFGLEHDNFAGFGFRPELEPDRMLLTAEGEIGDRQMVMIPKNLFDFDLNLVVNMLAHEMLHVRQKDPNSLVEDKNEREFQAYYEMLFHEIFPQVPKLSPFYIKQFGEKALEYYRRMGECSDLQQKYTEQKNEVEEFILSQP